MQTNQEKNLPKTVSHVITLLYFTIYLTVALTIALNQPLHDTPPSMCNPPDEHSRYMVPLYICNHGTLPTGFEEKLLSQDVKWTYGFYTLLPYMAQGYVMRLVNLFTDSPLILLYAARMVNVATGLGMAYIVLLLGKKLFRDERVKWLFCFLVMFLPQSLFLHTYVNPDSMCLFSTALILYGLVCGYEDDFALRSRIFLTIGIILCTLSYYNAYGFILGSIVLFAARFLNREDGGWRFDFRGFLRKGLPIAAVVILCTGWSFVRNYILYDGDIIGLATKENFIRSYGILRESPDDRGESLFDMLFRTDFFKDLIRTSIASYGSASLFGRRRIYTFYKLICLTGLLCAVLCRDRDNSAAVLRSDPKWRRAFFHGAMIFCMLMPFILLVRYAYTVDYQAQGRYILPGIIPFMYYVSRGLEKIPLRFKIPEKFKNCLFAAILFCIVAALCMMVYETSLPVWLQTTVL
ncbi:MAG: DUF2142 domain-containing protein [Clostridium sp.]|nr:DUF2142 domain-containing protein [Acetatifactor muris]MCM1527249.1 DUF2142 domain-containing protein [Bacteroides sp.]MCM1563056.1 DUF2142 domain-containing protein [Clostridium sp.]